MVTAVQSRHSSWHTLRNQKRRMLQKQETKTFMLQIANVLSGLNVHWWAPRARAGDGAVRAGAPAFWPFDLHCWDVQPFTCIGTRRPWSYQVYGTGVEAGSAMQKQHENGRVDRMRAISGTSDLRGFVSASPTQARDWRKVAASSPRNAEQARRPGRRSEAPPRPSSLAHTSTRRGNPRTQDWAAQPKEGL